MPRIAETAYAEFVRPDLPVIPVEDFGPEQHEMIENTVIQALRVLRRLGAPGSAPPVAFETVSTRRPDLRFFVSPGDDQLTVADAECALIGGVFEGTTSILPKHQRRGIAAEIHLLADEMGWALFDPSGFSPGGRASREAAHREAVLAAVAEGRPVHPDNLERYAALLPSPADDHGFGP